MKNFTLICLASLVAFSGGLLLAPFVLNQGYASDSNSIESYREQIHGLVQDMEGKVELPEDLDRIRYAFDLELDVDRQDMLLMAIGANATSEPGSLYRNIIGQSIHNRRNDAFLSKKLIESLKRFDPSFFDEDEQPAEGESLPKKSLDGIYLAIDLFCCFCRISPDDIGVDVEQGKNLAWNEVVGLQKKMKEVWHNQWSSESWDDVSFVR